MKKRNFMFFHCLIILSMLIGCEQNDLPITPTKFANSKTAVELPSGPKIVFSSPIKQGTIYYNCETKLVSFQTDIANFTELINDDPLQFLDLELIRDKIYFSKTIFVPQGNQGNKAFGPNEIFRIGLDGNNLEQITSDLYEDRNMSGSQSNAYIIYMSDHEGEPEEERYKLILLDTENLSKETLLEIDRPFKLKWSPQGNKIAVLLNASSKKSDSGIMIFSLQQDKVITSISGEKFKNSVLTWSPDGQQIAVTAKDQLTEKYRIEFYDVQTGTMKRSIQIENFIKQLSWSPDGRQILIETRNEFFVSNDHGYKLWALNLENDTLILLKDGVGDEGVLGFSSAWSPDGAFITYFIGDPVSSSTTQYLVDSSSYFVSGTVDIPCYHVDGLIWQMDGY